MIFTLNGGIEIVYDPGRTDCTIILTDKDDDTVSTQINIDDLRRVVAAIDCESRYA
jgi:hypothetical protein